MSSLAPPINDHTLINDNTLINDFKNYTTVVVNLSNYSYLFKSINCLDKIVTTTEGTSESILPLIAIALIFFLMMLSILKTILIYLSYYFIIIPTAIFTLINSLIKTKGQIRLSLVLTKISKSALSHLQTFYSYNFYSYTDPVSGVLIMVLYLLFITANMMMSIIYFIDPNLEPYSILYNLLYIAGFLPQLFLQIYTPLYYYKRKSHKFKLFFTTSFAFWFFLTGMTAYILNQDKLFGKNKEELKMSICIYYSIGFHIFVAIIQILAFHKMVFYNLNSIIINHIILILFGFREINKNANG